MQDELWLPIPGFEELYEASSLGRIRSKPRLRRGVSKSGNACMRLSPGRVLKPARHTAGYLSVSLTKISGEKATTLLVHRLVATAFLSNPEGLRCVNHKDADKLNNSAENLEWCTSEDNNRHAAALGLYPDRRGSQKGSAKLNEEKVAEIKKLILLGHTNKALGNLFNVSTAPISYIRSGLAWTHVPW